MSVKLRSIDRWQRLKETLPLPGKTRTVTIDFNVDEVTKLSVMQNKSVTLLRVIDPTECPLTVSFVVNGDCSILQESGNEVWWKSDDGVILSYEVITESFTELEQRMDTTPEMEITILKANIRHEQRMREVAELQLARKNREAAVAANADPQTGEIPDEKPDDVDTRAAKPRKAAGNGPAPEPELPGDGGAT